MARYNIMKLLILVAYEFALGPYTTKIGICINWALIISKALALLIFLSSVSVFDTL